MISKKIFARSRTKWVWLCKIQNKVGLALQDPEQSGFGFARSITRWVWLCKIQNKVGLDLQDPEQGGFGCYKLILVGLYIRQ